MADNFLQDYLHYTEGNMAPRRYHLWSAVSILAATAGRRFYFDHSYFRVYCMSFIALIGSQGIKKSTAKDLAKDLFIDAFPDYPIGPSVCSREDLVKRLSGDDWLRVYKDENGASVEWKPLIIFVNELKNFLSINPKLMIDTLTDLYDRAFYDASTIRHGLQNIINPCLNLLACETPRWITDNLKANIITGGFSRRVIFVYETAYPPRITFPRIPLGGIEARVRCIEHLKKIATLSGPFVFTPEARLFFDKWFKALPIPDDEIMAGYYMNKDILAIKLAMCLCIADYVPTTVLTIDKLQIAIAMLESLEENLPKLTIASGRSEIAVPQQQLLDLLSRRGGLLPEKVLNKESLKDFKNPQEQWSAMKALVDNETLVRKSLTVPPDRVERIWILLPETWKNWGKNGEVESITKTKENNNQ